jgi:hypothetical protein
MGDKGVICRRKLIGLLLILMLMLENYEFRFTSLEEYHACLWYCSSNTWFLHCEIVQWYVAATKGQIIFMECGHVEREII